MKRRIQFFSLILIIGLLAMIWWVIADRLTLAAGPLLQGRGAPFDLAVPTVTPTPQPVEDEAVPWEILPPGSSSSITVTVPFPHRPFDPNMLRSGQRMLSNDYMYGPLPRPAPIEEVFISRPAGVDLDVTYISRWPMYNRYEVWYTADGKPYLRPGTENDKRWPDYGESVTFTAHIMNKGTVASGAFAFKWFIDGVEVHSGTHPSLSPGEEGTETYQWIWAHTVDGERLLGQHTVRFVVDPGNAIVETYESNNSLEDRTDALSLVLAVTPELYAALETPVDPKWPYSAEDWLQKQIAAMNEAFARSVYPLAPNGIEERVRLDKILVTSTAPPADMSEDGGFFMSGDDRFGNAYYDPTTDVSGALLHELSHQLGVIDLYNLGFELEVPQVIDQNGWPLQMETGLPATGLMLNPGIRPPIYEEHSALALNANKGYRRGYYGEYLYDVPQQTYLRVLDNRGAPAPDVTVRLYQAGPGRGTYPVIIDNTPEIVGVTDANGLFLLPNRPVGAPVTTRTGHTLRDNPFGIIDVVGEKDEFVIELTKGVHQEYGWLEITQFNLAAWRGGGASATLDIPSRVPPVNAPAPPPDLHGRVESGRVQLYWPASPSSVIGYNVYRTANRPAFTYERVVQGTADLAYIDNHDYGSRAVVYTVTAVDSTGRESGFSRFFNAFRLINPAAIAVDNRNGRIVLDPQNGYALLYQSSDGRFLDTLGSVHYHLELSYYLARDPNGRLILSHPGDWYSSRHSIRVADQNAEPLFEFGERGSGPGQFETPAGVATWGQPCTIEGPYSVDEHTLLLLHFDSSYNGAQGEPGIPSGTTFTAGKYAQGVAIDSNDMLTYATAGNLNRAQGEIEFWIRPDWDGGDYQSYTFFEVGNSWFNRMRIMKDGANNLRFLLWDSTTEYGVGYNVAHWKAGEWHHIAVTWGGTYIALFVDGQQRASSDIARPPDSLAATLSIGASYVWRDQQANAVIDEFRISDIPRIGNSDTCNYRILVADSGNHRIQAFDAGGNFVSAYGSYGSGSGRFNNPQGLAVDSSGNVIVADKGNNRLQVLSFDGTNFGFIRSITSGFNGPTGVAAYGSNRIIVADTGNSRVKVFDATGNLLAEYVAPNDGHTGTFNQPRGVIADRSGNIVVADTGNRRVATVLGALPHGIRVFLPLILKR